MPRWFIASILSFMLSCYGMTAFAAGGGDSAAFQSNTVQTASADSGVGSADHQPAQTMPCDPQAFVDQNLSDDVAADPVELLEGVRAPVAQRNVWGWAVGAVAVALPRPALDGPMRPPRLRLLLG